MPLHYFALDLRDDPAAIEAYERWHRPSNIWPAIVRSLQDSGINDLELHRCGNRLLQVLDAPHGFSLSQKQEADIASPLQRAWEDLMWQFQEALPFASPGEKWVPMTRLFSLRETLDLLGRAPSAGRDVGSVPKPVQPT